MEYLLFVATDTEPDAQAEAAGEVEDWVAEGERRGIRLRGDVLRPIQDATLVRVRSGEVLVTDGPYTESKEWIVGYDIIDCEDLDQAIDYVSRHPMARNGRIEIRPVMQFDE
ncbi:MAG: YciI family protein [Pseudonocardiales bacterium]